jgi:tetratricopeptide (TPR) repeat protein
MSEQCVKHIEESWKQKTVFSNELFNKGKYDAALNAYTEALYRAEILNANYRDAMRSGIPFIQVFSISCNNLANTYEEMGELEDAAKMLKRVVYFLLHLSNDQDLNASEIQSELKRASLAYSSFADKHQLDKQEQTKVIQSIKTELMEK